MNSVPGNIENSCLLQEMVMKIKIALLDSIKLFSLQNRMLIGKTFLDI